MLTEPDALPPGLREGPLHRLLGPPRLYALTRFVLMRLLGLVYLAAFASAARQLAPLVGPDGPLDSAPARKRSQRGPRALIPSLRRRSRSSSRSLASVR